MIRILSATSSLLAASQGEMHGYFKAFWHGDLYDIQAFWETDLDRAFFSTYWDSFGHNYKTF